MQTSQFRCGSTTAISGGLGSSSAVRCLAATAIPRIQDPHFSESGQIRNSRLKEKGRQSDGPTYFRKLQNPIIVIQGPQPSLSFVHLIQIRSIGMGYVNE